MHGPASSLPLNVAMFVPGCIPGILSGAGLGMKNCEVVDEAVE